MTPVDTLDIPFESNDIGQTTVRGYLKELLFTLFKEDEGFSGKRPFGNSGWIYDIAKPLIVGGVIKGSLDSEGCVEDFDDDELQAAIGEAIAAL